MAKAFQEIGDKTGNERGLVRFAIVHLSGSRRGKTEEFEVNRLTVGTDPANDLTFDPARDPVVLPWHAEFSVEHCDLILRDRGTQGGTFVNHQCITEIILQDNDLVMFGREGPKVRIRIKPGAYANCKPLHDILCDCRDIAKAAQHGWFTSTALFFRHLLSELAFHATIPVRLLAGVIVLLPAVLLAGLLYTNYSSRWTYDRQISGLLSQLETGKVSREAMEQKIQKGRDQTAESVQILKQEVERLSILLQGKEKGHATEEDIVTLKQRLRTVEAEMAASEKIISSFRGGVALLQGTYGFAEKGTRRLLRYQGVDAEGEPLRDADGNPLFTFEGDTPLVTASFTGTGFLVDTQGFMLTNRHLANPWEMDQGAKQLMGKGLEPRLFMLRAFFPDVPTPFDLRVIKVSDEADVALVKFDPGNLRLPVLSLGRGMGKAAVGDPILLMGYPAGLDGPLARADQATISEILQRAGEDTDNLAQELANRKLIRPLTTQGHIGDTQSNQLIYDAQTTFGGSGGPVLNMQGEVIAINHMILRRFGGANFGVPIKFGIELLREAQRTG
jgi:S1-C subfamily serine protease